MAGKKAFGIKKEDLDHVQFVLEKDGTEVNEELLKTLGKNTCLIILKQHECWSSGKKINISFFIIYTYQDEEITKVY